jgi:hypothetical protein
MKSSGITLIVLWILASTTCVKSQLLNELAAAEPKKFYLAIKKSVAQTWRPIRGISEVSLKACGHRNPSVEADETLIGKLSLLAEEIVELESALRGIGRLKLKPMKTPLFVP